MPPRSRTRPGPPADRPARSTSTCAPAPPACWLPGVHGGGVFTATDLDRTTAANFIAFLEELDAKVPARREVHLVLDNGSCPSPATPAGVVDHPRLHPHSTPGHASWLNQVELFFSILARRRLKRGQFRSVEDLVAKVMAFIADDTAPPHPCAGPTTAGPSRPADMPTTNAELH